MIEKAYTIIELLIVITLVSIVFFIGYAGFRDFSRRQALNGVSKVIKSDLRLIQQFASSGQKPTTGICNKLDGYTFEILDNHQYTIRANCSNPTDVDILIKTVDIVNINRVVTFDPLPAIMSVQFKVLGQGTNLVSNFTIRLTHVSGNIFDITVGKGGDVN